MNEYKDFTFIAIKELSFSVKEQALHPTPTF